MDNLQKLEINQDWTPRKNIVLVQMTGYHIVEILFETPAAHVLSGQDGELHCGIPEFSQIIMRLKM